MDPRLVAVPSTGTQLVGPNERRWGLIIGAGQAGVLLVNPRQLPATAIGLPIAANGQPLYLMWHHMGQAIREDWYAYTSGSTQQIAVWDIFFG